MLLFWMGLQVRRWLRVNDENGQGMVEYGLIIALVAIALIAVLTTMEGSISNVFTKVTTEMNTASS